MEFTTSPIGNVRCSRTALNVTSVRWTSLSICSRQLRIGRPAVADDDMGELLPQRIERGVRETSTIRLGTLMTSAPSGFPGRSRSRSRRSTR